MDTPIWDFVQSYIKSGMSRLHMPGHKGKSFLGIEALDITEIPGADDLYNPDGIIAKSEQNAAKLFGAGKTLYSAEGSSHCIKAMLYTALMVRKPGMGRTVLAARNVHKTFVFACALLDVEPEWLFPEDRNSLYSCAITAVSLEKRLADMPEKPFAVFITSPDYLGVVQDIHRLSNVCKKYGVPLLVDNAHGAYLHFLPEPQHPLDAGADMCCDSGHKTLPVLTGGAYLHVSKTAPERFYTAAQDALALFGSTSPSYLIMQSLDTCNRYLDDGYRQKLEQCVLEVKALKARFACICPSEPLKLVFDAAAVGATGYAAAEALRREKAECEFCDNDFLVLMFTPENSPEDFTRVYRGLSGLKRGTAREKMSLSGLEPERKLSIREAVFAVSETVPVNDAVGRVCALPTASCPPAVPVVVSGELISQEAVQVLKACGFDEVRVVFRP